MREGRPRMTRGEIIVHAGRDLERLRSSPEIPSTLSLPPFDVWAAKWLINNRRAIGALIRRLR
jgi:hypothetical protein